MTTLILLSHTVENPTPSELDASTPSTGNRTILRQIFFGRFVCHGLARHLILHYDVKARPFYGNTSMEAEMSLLMAGQTLSAPGKMVYDPFAGTGSLLYTCAHWGSVVVGSDIDGRQMRGKQGKGQEPGVFRAAEAYGVRDRVLDCLTFDVTRNMWRRGGILDAIITDPPCESVVRGLLWRYPKLITHFLTQME